MALSTTALTALALCGVATAYVSPVTTSAVSRHATRVEPLFGYVPDGLSKSEWEAIKKKEADERKKKNFGEGGTRGFKSRSMWSFIEAYEKGEAQHLYPVNPAKVKSGEIALKDVPYMQRGGSWDNSDLTKNRRGWVKTGFGMTAFNDGKAQKLKSNKYDKYNDAKPSISIFGTEVAVDWTGKGGRGDKVAERAKKNGISADQQMWRDAGALSAAQARKVKASKLNNMPGEKKKLFGLF